MWAVIHLDGRSNAARTQLVKANGRPATRVEQELLIARFDQGAGAETID
jgi:hypothetical protein